ncbi:putative calcium-transporting ATPase 13, plasma membrane-type [Camellia lanceoleosa]|uniref:Calcium-transporting ATPase 13, plasma membrane-type n=1 Tax=Camellia lanceoleosa TaxID=1840588 RepID=A0ACC0GA09_9ERIC|nr:putative calcium-transporting ATPase 13, plasma membrane-type [Camellia lanceoleosa]
MARSSPFDKLLMVKGLKRKRTCGSGHRMEQRCTCTERSRCRTFNGNSRHRSGKESSDIVILDDNFTSVVTVLKWGRCVYNNIQKFIHFNSLSTWLPLSSTSSRAISSGEVPLTAVQLLWVNLIMDTLGALALATEQPTNDLMTKQPVGRTEPLITKIMWRNPIAQAGIK